MAINNHAGINADTVLAAIAAGAADIDALANHFGVASVNAVLRRTLWDLAETGRIVRVDPTADMPTFTIA